MRKMIMAAAYLFAALGFTGCNGLGTTGSDLGAAAKTVGGNVLSSVLGQVAGTATTTGTSNTTASALGTVLSGLLGNLAGSNKTYNFTGTATSQSLYGSYASSSWSFANSNKTNTLNNMAVTLKAGNTATITIPAYTDGKVKYSAINIYNLAMTANSSQSTTTLTISDNSTIDGTVTYNGATYSAANLYITSATATSGGLNLEMTVYFKKTDGTDYCNAVNITYKGAAVTQ